MKEEDNDFDIEKFTIEGKTDYKKIIQQLTGDLPEGALFSFQRHAPSLILPDFETDWIECLTNFFLIRDPKEILLSYYKANNEKVKFQYISIDKLYDLFKKVEAFTGKTPLVIHADDVLKNPRFVMKFLCDYLGVTFDEKMLSWEPELKNSKIPDIYKYFTLYPPDQDPWFATLKNTQSFLPYEKKPIDLPDELIPLLEECMPYYEKLLQHRQVFDWSD